ncbi:MAG: helical backbone metal receptor [Anaerolineales bacterium]
MTLTPLTQYQMPLWDHSPRRVVSLVPSITESLFTLGFGGAVAGITDYCTRPTGALGVTPRVGGPKFPNLDLIAELKPDLVIANQEETDQQAVEAIAGMDIPVWLVFPKSVDDGMFFLRQLLALFHTDKPVSRINALQVSVDYARAAADSMTPVPYFCPIWVDVHEGIDWWMTFNQNTYMADVLRMFGGVNIFADRERQYPLEADLGLGKSEPPGERDIRYPRVTAAEVIGGQPEVIFLPDDPYKFSASDRSLIEYALANTPAVRNKKIYFLDGSLITWFGVRIGEAIHTLPEYFG